MKKILEDLGFKCNKEKKYLKLTVPSWRPDILQEIDIVEELVRISGYEKIKIIDPIKERKKIFKINYPNMETRYFTGNRHC